MFFVGNFKVLTTCTLTVLVPELLTSGLLAYTIGPLGFSEKKTSCQTQGCSVFKLRGRPAMMFALGDYWIWLVGKNREILGFFGPETGNVLHIFRYNICTYMYAHTIYIYIFVYTYYMYRYKQSIATSHDLTPNGRVVRDSPHKWPYVRKIQVGETLQFVYIYKYIIYIYIHMYIHIHIISTPVPKNLILSLVVLPSNSWGYCLCFFLDAWIDCSYAVAQLPSKAATCHWCWSHCSHRQYCQKVAQSRTKIHFWLFWMVDFLRILRLVGPRIQLYCNWVEITPTTRVISEQFAIYFRPFIGAPYHSIYNSIRGPPCRMVNHDERPPEWGEYCFLFLSNHLLS